MRFLGYMIIWLALTIMVSAAVLHFSRAAYLKFMTPTDDLNPNQPTETGQPNGG